jgi:hypoxanthine phosphoribosyltransferase
LNHQVLFTTEQIRVEVDKLAESVDSAGKRSYLVLTVLKGAAIFSSDLVRIMRTPTELEYITASSYSGDFTPGQSIDIEELHLNATGRHVLIVEDIIDTGRTLERIHRKALEEHPATVTTVTLVSKTSRRNSAFEPDHYGFTITDELIYGYGLDFNQQYRDLPYIAIAPKPGSHEGTTLDTCPR